MQRLVCAVLMVVLVTQTERDLPAQSPFYHSQNFSTGLIGWWKLCGDTAMGGACAASAATAVGDSSGSGNTGTWSGSAAGSIGYYAAGKVGPWAGYFNGSNNKVLLPGLGLTGSSDITLCAWVNFSTLSQSDFLQIGGQSSGAAVSIDYDPDYNRNLNLVTYASTSRLTSSFTPTVGIWYFICAVLTGGNTGRLYVNATQQAAGTLNYAGLAGSNGYLIGSYGSGGYLNGSVNEVRIYNRALSAGEITAMYLMHN